MVSAVIKFNVDSDLNFAYGNFKKMGWVTKVDPKGLLLSVSMPGTVEDVSKMVMSLGIVPTKFSIKD